MTRSDLAIQAHTAWRNYASTVRFGGTNEERTFAFTQAVKAERALADHDRATMPQDDREQLARALSGA
jgi:hypothetical protein